MTLQVIECDSESFGGGCAFPRPPSARRTSTSPVRQAHACTMAIVLVCTLAMVHTRTMALSHECTMANVHAYTMCTIAIVRACTCPTRQIGLYRGEGRVCFGLGGRSLSLQQRSFGPANTQWALDFEKNMCQSI